MSASVKPHVCPVTSAECARPDCGTATNGTAASACADQNRATADQAPEQAHTPFETMSILRILTVALSAGAVWFRLWEPYSAFSIIGAAGLLFGGWPILKEAFENLVARRMTMELSMSIAIIAAAGIAEFFTALVVTFFVLVAEELEHMTMARGRTAIRDLIDFMPQDARVRRNGEVITVGISDLAIGELVLVAPGERVAIDGRVVDGHSYVDQSMITGESVPAEKAVGAQVFAGSVNQIGRLEVLVERLGRDTSYGRIIDAVETAETSRAPVQRVADQLAGYLVYFAIGAAILTYLLTRDIRDTISVVIVAGACGVAAGTPLAVLGGIGRAARNGAIIKGGAHLEMLSKVNTMVFDKTGTLTLGEPKVEQILHVAAISENDLLALAASAEFNSEHPLARAIVAEAQLRDLDVIEPETFKYQLGLGISATVNGARLLVGNRKLMAEAGIEIPDAIVPKGAASELFVARNQEMLGAVVVADPLREGAKHTIADLNAMGIETVLLSGDTKAVAAFIANQLGISNYLAEMLPEEKLTQIDAMMARGRIVAMVGDGVNDAPSLAKASVGIAMGSGTDVAKESADIVLLANDLGKLVETVRIARRSRRVIWQNFSGTIGVDAIGIALAAFGFLNPLIAAFIHVSSELVFILNSARLLPAADRLKIGASKRRALAAQQPTPAILVKEKSS